MSLTEEDMQKMEKLIDGPDVNDFLLEAFDFVPLAIAEIRKLRTELKAASNLKERGIPMQKPMTIYKFGILPTIRASMPKGADIIHVDAVDGDFFTWAIVDPAEKEYELRKIVIVGTGDALPEEPRIYLGTCFDGPFVWHFFEELPLEETRS